MKTTVYSSDKNTHFFRELRDIFCDIKKSNFLAYQMAKRDLQSQYRQSVLGIIWAFIPIIVNSVTWIFLNSSGSINVKSPTGIPYNLYVIIGSTLWSIFIDGLQAPINSINSGKAIISKINFPKEALIISGLYKNFFNLILKLIIVIFFLFFYNTNPSSSLYYFPLYLLVLTLFSTAIGLLLAPIGLLYSDIGRIITMGGQFLMYITPVVYMIPESGWTKILFTINPLTYLINDSRASLIGGEINDQLIMLYILSGSIILILIGLVLLRKSINILIEKIS